MPFIVTTVVVAASELARPSCVTVMVASTALVPTEDVAEETPSSEASTESSTVGAGILDAALISTTCVTVNDVVDRARRESKGWPCKRRRRRSVLVTTVQPAEGGLPQMIFKSAAATSPVVLPAGTMASIAVTRFTLTTTEMFASGVLPPTAPRSSEVSRAEAYVPDRADRSRDTTVVVAKATG